MDEEDESLKFNSENRARQKRVAILEFIYHKVLKPPEWLEGLESPFKWGLDIRSIELVRWHIPGKLCDYNNQGAFYGFERLAFLLTMLFLKTTDNEEEKMFVKERGSDESEDSEDSDKEEEVDDYEPEKAYEKCRETIDEMAASEGDLMYSRIGPALQHVLQATRAHMLFFNGNIAESQELARNIQPIEDMSQKCKAGFEGLKAKVIMSMYQNYIIVLQYLRKAMELDPGFGYWPYLLGKVLRRFRREFDKGTIEKELGYFEKAVSLERNPKFLVFLAQAYQEQAMTMFHAKEPMDSTNSFKQKAAELYRECWSLKNDSAAISRRVGNGLLKMPSEFIDKTVAKEALLKAIELSPNETTHLAIGKFYYIHEKNDEKALEHFKKFHPSDFGSSEIIRLNLIKDPTYDPLEILQEWLVYEDNAVKQYRSFCDAAWYYLVFKRDLKSAANYIWRVLAIDNKFIRAKRATEYRSYGFCVEGPVNLVEVIVNEILLEKDKNVNLPPEEQKNMERLENLLEKFLDKYPDLRNINPQPNLIQDLKQEVDRYIAMKRRWRYGSVYNRRNNHSRDQEEPGSWRNSCSSNDAHESNNREPFRRQESDVARNYTQWQRGNSTNRGNYSRTDTRTRLSFSLGDDDERRNSRDDRRRHSESQSNWGGSRADGEGSSNQTEAHRRFGHNSRGRPYNNYNNNRYDVTITDWRSENRRQ